MKIILKENIENLGKKGDIINVAAGYGRNYLIPKKMALEITSTNTKMIEIEQKALQKGLEKEMMTYQSLVEKLNKVTLTYERKAGDKDSIFGSVSTNDIKDGLDKLNFNVEKKKILLPEPIKKLGNYKVPIKIFHEQIAEISLEVNREGTPDQKVSPSPNNKKEKDSLPSDAPPSLDDKKEKNSPPKVKKDETYTETPVKEKTSTEDKK